MLCTIPHPNHNLLVIEPPLEIAPCEDILAHYDQEDRWLCEHYPRFCDGHRCTLYWGSICLESSDAMTTPAVVWYRG